MKQATQTSEKKRAGWTVISRGQQGTFLLLRFRSALKQNIINSIYWIIISMTSTIYTLSTIPFPFSEPEMAIIIDGHVYVSSEPSDAVKCTNLSTCHHTCDAFKCTFHVLCRVLISYCCWLGLVAVECADCGQYYCERLFHATCKTTLNIFKSTTISEIT